MVLSPVFLFPRPSCSGVGGGGNQHFRRGGGRIVCPWPHWLPGQCSLGLPRPPRSEPRAPKSDPRPNQDPPRAIQDPPRATQDPLREAQEPPRAAQDHPKRTQDRLKSPQERSWPPRMCKNHWFSLCFSMFFENSIFATKTAGKSILVPQGPAKSAQERSKSGQDRPKSAQDRL